MKRYLIYIIMIAMCCSCVDEDQYDDTPRGNFEALWRIFDEHYCFFSYKKSEYGLDWNAIYQKYSPQFSNQMSEGQMFEVMANMLSELRDGHVNIYSTFDVARNWSWHEDYPQNFSESLLRLYRGTDYQIAAGMEYLTLDDNIGYIRYSSFANGIGEGNIDAVFSTLATCNGLIIDIRDNGGGNLSTAEQLASHFTNKEILVGYMQHKTGRGHDDFSPMEEQRLKPSNGMRWQKPVVVLTNRSVFSAANEFVKYMKCCPNVTIVGDKTGGGAGMPFSSELPCGWAVRFSACPMYDRDKQSTEFGIDPDYYVSITSTDYADGKDTIIEFARHLLSSQ